MSVRGHCAGQSVRVAGGVRGPAVRSPRLPRRSAPHGWRVYSVRRVARLPGVRAPSAGRKDVMNRQSRRKWTYAGAVSPGGFSMRAVPAESPRPSRPPRSERNPGRYATVPLSRNRRRTRRWIAALAAGVLLPAATRRVRGGRTRRTPRPGTSARPGPAATYGPPRGSRSPPAAPCAGRWTRRPARSTSSSPTRPRRPSGWPGPPCPRCSTWTSAAARRPTRTSCAAPRSPTPTRGRPSSTSSTPRPAGATGGGWVRRTSVPSGRRCAARTTPTGPRGTPDTTGSGRSPRAPGTTR